MSPRGCIRRFISSAQVAAQSTFYSILTETECESEEVLFCIVSGSKSLSALRFQITSLFVLLVIKILFWWLSAEITANIQSHDRKGHLLCQWQTSGFWPFTSSLNVTAMHRKTISAANLLSACAQYHRVPLVIFLSGFIVCAQFFFFGLKMRWQLKAFWSAESCGIQAIYCHLERKKKLIPPLS